MGNSCSCPDFCHYKIEKEPVEEFTPIPSGKSK